MLPGAPSRFTRGPRLYQKRCSRILGLHHLDLNVLCERVPEIWFRWSLSNVHVLKRRRRSCDAGFNGKTSDGSDMHVCAHGLSAAEAAVIYVLDLTILLEEHRKTLGASLSTPIRRFRS